MLLRHNPTHPYTTMPIFVAHTMGLVQTHAGFGQIPCRADLWYAFPFDDIFSRRSPHFCNWEES